MKALDEYFLMVVSTLLLNAVHVFANFIFKFEHGSERINVNSSEWISNTRQQDMTLLVETSPR